MNVDVDGINLMMDKMNTFFVAYGLQILGALIILFVGLKLAGLLGRKTEAVAKKRMLDPTLSKFAGNAVRLVSIGIVIIITLEKFGLGVGPLIAVSGAVALGVSLAIQGPISNYGAGLVIITLRPFVVGNTIEVRDTYGVVDEIRLAATILKGEDGETITIPNKQILGEILTNSEKFRVVETKIYLGFDQDAEKAMGIVKETLAKFDIGGVGSPSSQIGVHEFVHGGIIIGARFWVPSLRYFELRYDINKTIYLALGEAGIKLLAPASPVVVNVPAGGEVALS